MSEGRAFQSLGAELEKETALKGEVLLVQSSPTPGMRRQDGKDDQWDRGDSQQEIVPENRTSFFLNKAARHGVVFSTVKMKAHIRTDGYKKNPTTTTKALFSPHHKISSVQNAVTYQVWTWWIKRRGEKRCSHAVHNGLREWIKLSGKNTGLMIRRLKLKPW